MHMLSSYIQQVRNREVAVCLSVASYIRWRCFTTTLQALTLAVGFLCMRRDEPLGSVGIAMSTQFRRVTGDCLVEYPPEKKRASLAM